MKTHRPFGERILESSLLLIFIVLIAWILVSSMSAYAVPQGANISILSTENGTLRPADSHSAQGGSFTTMVLNVTSQTSSWKAYVGNVTGRITLENTNGKAIYDWALTTVQGEIYVSRNDSVQFSSLACANVANISSEQGLLSINGTSSDSINNTFVNKKHRQFVIGGSGLISNSSCYSVSTYVNSTGQAFSENATFQEILLSDGRNLVYTSLLENKRSGFDLNAYDFQVIIPDDPTQVATKYYFYAELG